VLPADPVVDPVVDDPVVLPVVPAVDPDIESVDRPLSDIVPVTSTRL